MSEGSQDVEPPLGRRPCYPVRRRGKPTSASQPAPSAMQCQAGLRRGGRENRRNGSECAASSERRQRLTPRPYRVRARPWWEMRFSPGAEGRTAGRTGGRDALPRKGTASASFLGQMRMSSAQQVLTSSSSEWQPQWGPQRAPVSARLHAIGRDGQAGQKQKKQK